MPYVNTSLEDCSSVDDHVLNRHSMSASLMEYNSLYRGWQFESHAGVRNCAVSLTDTWCVKTQHQRMYL